MASRKTVAALNASLEKLQYGHWDISGVEAHAGLKSSVATVRLASDNVLLKMQGNADMRLDRSYLDGALDLNVEEVNLHKLGLVPRPLKHPFAFTMGAEARHDSLKLRLDAGDLNLRFRAHSTLKKLMEQSDKFVVRV